MSNTIHLLSPKSIEKMGKLGITLELPSHTGRARLFTHNRICCLVGANFAFVLPAALILFTTRRKSLRPNFRRFVRNSIKELCHLLYRNIQKSQVFCSENRYQDWTIGTLKVTIPLGVLLDTLTIFHFLARKILGWMIFKPPRFLS